MQKKFLFAAAIAVMAMTASAASLSNLEMMATSSLKSGAGNLFFIQHDSGQVGTGLMHDGSGGAKVKMARADYIVDVSARPLDLGHHAKAPIGGSTKMGTGFHYTGTMTPDGYLVRSSSGCGLSTGGHVVRMI